MQKLAVVYFPNLDLDEINSFRQKYDPKWEWGINPDIDKEVIAYIEKYLSGTVRRKILTSYRMESCWEII